MKSKKLDINNWSVKSLLIILFFLLISIVVLWKFVLPQKASASWWNDGWNYRKAVSISNTSGSNQNNTQVKIFTNYDLSALVTSGKLQGDLDDLRFTDINGNLIKYWIEDSTNNSADVWAFLPSIPASGATIYMYYGNPSITNGETIVGTKDNPGLSCKAIKLSGGTLDNIYYIDPTGGNVADAIQIYCDLNTDSGGWMLIGKSDSTIYAHAPGFFADGNIPTKINRGSINVFNLSLVNNSAEWMWQDTINSQYVKFSLTKYSTIKASPDTYTKTNDDTGQRFISSTITSASSLYQFTAVGNSQAPANAGNFSYATSSHTQYGQWGFAYYAGGSQSNARIFLITNSGGHEGSYGLYGLERYNPTPYIAVNSVMMVREAAFVIDSNFSSTFQSEEAGGGPIAYWKFDEGIGTTAYDSTTNQNNGSFLSVPIWKNESECISGKCLSFDNVDDGVSINKNFIGLTDYTMSAWINLKGTHKNYAGAIMSSGNWNNQWWSFCINQANNGIYLYGIGTKNYNFQLNKWTHVTVTRNGGLYTFYVDGKNIGSFSASSSPLVSDASNTTIGRETYSGGYFAFNGWIDEPKIYTYARTAAQIKLDYNSRGSSKGTTANLGSAASDSNLSDGLVGYWKMDENTGTVTADSSGNNITGTFSGSTLPAWSSGKYGVGTSFNGVNSYIDIGNSSPIRNFTNQITVSVWAKYSAYGGGGQSYSVLAVKGTPWTFLMENPSNKIRFRVTVGGQDLNASDSQTHNLNQWYHFVGTYDGQNIKMYKDGVLVGTTPATGNLGVNDVSAKIGTYTGSSYNFNGLIDEVRIYNRALSPSEVTQLYEFAPGPITYYDFNEASGTIANDKSGNNHSGTLQSSPSWVQGKYGGGLDFKASGQKVLIGNPTPISGQATATLWYKRTSTASTTWRTLLGDASNNIHHLISNSASRNLGIWDGSFRDFGYNPPDDNQFHNYAVIYDVGSSATLYVDGIYKNKIYTTLNLTTNPIGIIGNQAGSNYWAGGIDDVKIYNYARTQKQIIEDMNANHPAVSAKSAIAYYKFDEGYGTTTSNWGNGGTTLNGTFGTGNSAPTWTNDGKFGKALNFGVNNYLTITDNNHLLNFGTNDFTISFYTYRTATGLQGGSYFGKGGYTTGIDSYDNIFRVNTINGELAHIALNANLNQWEHHLLTVTQNSTPYIKHYINGKLDNTGYVGVGNTGSYGSDSTSSLIIGYSNAGGVNRFFNGTIDNFKIYNYALNSEEIKQDYNQGSALQMGQTSQTIGGTTTSLEYCIPGDTSYCASPIAEYKLDEGTGSTTYDTSGNNKNGTWQGTLGNQWSQGKIGQAGKFNGTNNYILGSSNLGISGNAEFTMCAWMKWTGSLWSSNYPSFMGNNSTGYSNGLSFTVSSGRPAIDFWSLRWKASSALSLNTWYYVCGTKTPGTVSTTSKIYINGQLVPGAVEGTDTTPNITDSPPIVGRLDGTRWFNGLIDQARYYNYARTPAQIAYDYNKGGPVGWWKFDECQGNIAYDWSGIGNTGTIIIGASGTQNSLGTCQSGTSAAWTNGATGKLNSSLNFDGVDDYININDNPSLKLPDTYSLSVWVKPTTVSGWKTILEKGVLGTRYMFWLNNDEISAVGHKESPYTTTTNANLVAGQWTHLIYTFDYSGSPQAKIYKNGILLNSTNTTGIGHIPDTSGSLLRIGDDPDSQNYFYSGQIDDVRIYNYALTTEQVKTLYNGGAVNFQ